MLFPHVPLFFFDRPATTEIYTLSLHDALPICHCVSSFLTKANDIYLSRLLSTFLLAKPGRGLTPTWLDRKSTRLNSSHTVISYAVFCLKKQTRRVAGGPGCGLRRAGSHKRQRR